MTAALQTTTVNMLIPIISSSVEMAILELQSNQIGLCLDTLNSLHTLLSDMSAANASLPVVDNAVDGKS